MRGRFDAGGCRRGVCAASTLPGNPSCHRVPRSLTCRPGLSMHQRRLPPFHNLSSFLSFLEDRGELRTVAAPVSMHLEMTELHRRVIAAGGPVLRVARPLVAGGALSERPVVANLFGTVERVAWGLGTDVDGLEPLGALLAWMRSPQPPRSLREARRLL
ncbi:MAG: hypothetical protein WBA66_09465, partial [Xanthobacteraceae bacterium]